MSGRSRLAKQRLQIGTRLMEDLLPLSQRMSFGAGGQQQVKGDLLLQFLLQYGEGDKLFVVGGSGGRRFRLLAAAVLGTQGFFLRRRDGRLLGVGHRDNSVADNLKPAAALFLGQTLESLKEPVNLLTDSHLVRIGLLVRLGVGIGIGLLDALVHENLDLVQGGQENLGVFLVEAPSGVVAPDGVTADRVAVDDTVVQHAIDFRFGVGALAVDGVDGDWVDLPLVGGEAEFDVLAVTQTPQLLLLQDVLGVEVGEAVRVSLGVDVESTLDTASIASSVVSHNLVPP